MKFIFPILSIIVCVGAAYFSWTESEKFQKVQTQRLEADATDKVVTANKDAAEVKIKEEREILAAAKDRLAVLEQTVAALEADGVSLKRDLTRLDSRLETQDAEFAELDEVMKEVESVFAGLGDVNIDNLGDKIEEIEAELASKNEKVEELEVLVEKANGALVNAKKDVSSLVKRKAARSKRIAANSLVTRVTAVNQDWGFLVVGAGSNSGYRPDTTLLIQRNGRLIGRALPTAVEPTQTIADIDMDSLSPGVRIQTGDSIIIERPASN